ncbi:hypothetical protein BHE90_016001 [Fusarium euwallaceae]|uniref:Uncharacterized protein n=1 Tax=Fusarium euwallaceae TaxID=1147111 RepID=A0A430L1R2_9HYPO|nr:hypothetical protein BHE90_016001 [Fusarium euwallaceae]
MATGDVITAVPIPGLQRPFTKYDMKESTVIVRTRRYNGLPLIQAEMHDQLGRLTANVGGRQSLLMHL